MFINYRILFRIYLLCSVLIWLIAIQSVYKLDPSAQTPELKVQIEINASVNAVYSYLGNSDNAQTWSVYVSSIETLNAELYRDGEQGNIRRCFVKGSQDAQFWDEEILQNDKDQLRQLSIFNFNNFPMSADNLVTEQRYFQKADGFCMLEFSLHFAVSPRFLDQLKMHFASRIIAGIFQQNLMNIKQDIETKSGNNVF